MALTIRKLETKEESERKSKRNTLILSILMIGILLFSTAGYFSLGDDTTAANSKNVENIGDSWILRYQGQTFRVTNSPEDGQNVSILTGANIEKYSGKTVYVSTENDAQFYEIYSTLGAYTGRMQQACYGACDKNLPEKNCTDTMIVVRSLNDSSSLKTGQGKIYEGNNCVFIEGGMTAVDAFLYKIFRIT